jgi:hypothetical protein
VERRGGERRIEENLRVVVSVNVDEPGRHHVSGRVECLAAVQSIADRRDAPIGDGHIGGEPGSAGAVDDETSGDHDVGDQIGHAVHGGAHAVSPRTRKPHYLPVRSTNNELAGRSADGSPGDRELASAT